MHVHLSNPLAKQPASYVRRKNYRMTRTLGEGTFGIVRLATWTVPHPPKTVAVKVIPKRILKGNLSLVESETNVVKELSHPNIVRLYDNFESKDKFYLVFEPAMGGEVFDRILQTGHLTEHEATHVVASVASALQYIHSHGFVHRDVKPENIMYLRPPEEDPESRIVLVDFGVAQHLNPDGEKLHELAGSLGYAAPEVVAREPYGEAVDIWSLGAVTYVMLCGHMPYKNQTPKELLQEMLAGPVQCTGKYWDQISKEAIEFIQQCMNTDVEARLTADQVLANPWVLHDAEALQVERPNIAAGLRENWQLRPKTRAPTLAPSSTSSSRTTTQHELISSDEEDDAPDAAEAPAYGVRSAPTASTKPSSPEQMHSSSAQPSSAKTAPDLDEKRQVSSSQSSESPGDGHNTAHASGTVSSEKHHNLVDGIKGIFHHH